MRNRSVPFGLDRPLKVRLLLTAVMSVILAVMVLLNSQYATAQTAGGEPIGPTRDDIVAHRGLLGRDELMEVVRRCRLFLFPSEYEAMSMMLLEAISCRRPVVVSEIPENTELLVPDYPYTFRVADAASLDATLTAALEDPNVEAWGDRLFERCMRDFGWKTIAESYEDSFRQLGPQLGSLPA